MAGQRTLGIGGVAVRLLALVVVLAGVFALARFLPHAPAEDPLYGDTPILRINSNQHISAITRAGLSADGKLMVTASRDNTIKVWRVADMAVLNTLRVPITNDYLTDPGAAFLWAVDISPDGQMIAVSGQVRTDGTSRVFILNTFTGEIIAPVATMRGFIGDLAFSRDGKLLAVGNFYEAGHPDNGLWVWDTSNWRTPIYRDTDYGYDDAGKPVDRGGRINGLKFNAAGVLITASYDRHLRRYADVRSGAPPLRIATPPVVVPYEMDFSPDGNQIVVGLQNRVDGDEPAAVTIYNAADLTPIRSLDVSGLEGERGERVSATTVRGVGYSRSGRYIYGNIIQHAVGGQDERVRRWPVSNDSEEPRDYPNCTDQTVIQVLPYEQDGALLLNSDPCVYAIGNDGEVIDRNVRTIRYPIYYDDLPAVDARGELLVSRRGERFYIRGEQDGQGFLFDLRTRSLKLNSDVTRSDLQDLNGYTQEAGNIKMEHWTGGGSPTMSGAPVNIRDGPLRNRNDPFSVDVAPNGAFAVLGNVFDLRRYSRADKPDWNISTTALVMRTNITPDANVVLAYYLDGVMRWHDAQDGHVILSMMIDRTGTRWIMWTPGGYYDSSPGADDMIGWHLNHGADAAPSFEPASRYADAFRRPDVINEVVDAMVQGRATRGAQEIIQRAQSLDFARELIRSRAPPIARIERSAIVAEAGKPPVLDVTYSIVSPSRRPVTATEVDVDGSSLPVQRHDSLALRLTQRVPIHRGDRYVRVRARTQDGWGSAVSASIADAVYDFTFPRDVPPGAGRGVQIRQISLPQRELPTLHALVVGVNYRGAPPGDLDPLNYAVADAEAVGAFLNAQNGNTTLFRRADVRIVREQEATLPRLQAELRRLTQVDRRDIVLIFLAGHGVPDTAGNYYFIPYGVQPNGATIARQALTGREISETIRATRARAILLMDTCSSQGALDRGFLSRILSLEKNVYTFTSSRDGQASEETRAWGHGAFTKAFLEAARGGNPRIAEDQLISYSELGPFLVQRVSNLTRGRQTPQYFGWGPEGANPDAELFRIAAAR
jgi:hypothetical protein